MDENWSRARHAHEPGEPLTMFGIDYILAPHRLEDFLATFWGQRALHIPGDAGKFDGLFGWEDINHLLTHGRLAPPAISLVLEKRTLPPQALSQVDHWLAEGATLVLNQIQELDAVVDRFASALASDLNVTVGVNSYASWPSKQGFDMHYDLHDVFVVQVAGSKAWKVFEPTRRWPIEREKGVVTLAPPDKASPYLECSLAEGDVLHIPRGHWHYAVAETPSIHLTVGPKARTGVDFLLWLADEVMKGEELFRKDFPLVRSRALGGDRPGADLESHWRELADRLRGMVTDDTLLEGFLRAGVVATKIRRTYQLPELVTLRELITPETRFVLAPHQKALVPETGSPLTTVVMRGVVLNLENVPETLLRAFFDRTAGVCAMDLTAACPELGEEQIKKFLLQLFERGVLHLADDASGVEEPA
jgi:ribosomal protein L16 Arg81 hydroxylase